jgi:hypothetical protein
MIWLPNDRARKLAIFAPAPDNGKYRISGWSQNLIFKIIVRFTTTTQWLT